jgi:hypothetical protein
MKILYSLVAILCLASFSLKGQGLEGILVERYYETDAADEANALDNGAIVPLPAGSVVYRVFVDMADGYKFSQIFGTVEHPLTVNATADFYNDPSYGVTVNPATISANNIRKHTALIDSWFTTGGASNGKVGVLKIEDTDGSVGNQHGVLGNNPGGCYGLPINGAGAQDGMTPNSPTTYLVPNSLGISGALEALDQTAGNSIFIDGGAIAALGGIVGPTATNRVMIAQFTVNGDITFALNVQLVNVATGAAENYVASSPVSGELTHPSLTYNSNIAPTISLTSPANGATIGFGDYTLTADASDVQGYVTAVEFFVDGVSVGIDNSAPYEVVYSATVGSHTIYAVAVDGDCLTAQTQTINVAVSSNSAPTITLDAPETAVEGSAVTLSSTASAAGGATITQVQFFVDGVLVGTDVSAPYSVVWTATLGADQEITAVATDNNGLSTTSNVILITVNPNVAPVVSITFPFSTSDFIAPDVVAIMAQASDADGTIVSVEFFVNGVSVGVTNSEPYTVNWVSQAGPAEITAVATDSNGAQTTSVSVNLIVLDPSTQPYAVGSLTQPCSTPEFCVPISASAAFPVSGVIGYDITMNYDATALEPYGVYELSNDMIDSDLVSATLTNVSPGVLQVMIALNGNAPAGTQYQGSGDLICVRFNRLPGLGATDSTEVTVSSLIESYTAGIQTVDVSSAYLYSEANSYYTGIVVHGATGAALNANESTSASTPQTLVFGATAGTINTAENAVEVDLGGGFMHDLNNGLEVAIDRDINNAASIQQTVNGADVLLTKALLNGTYTPSIWEILAMDVNLDGVVSAGDISQMNQRATLMIGEYQQAWNTAGQPSKDWIFVDEARLSTPAFALSATFPADDQVGFSAARVPSVPFALATGASDFNPNSTTCQEWETANYKAILLGDVNGSYGTDLQNNQDSVRLDLSQAVITSEGGSSFVEIPVIAEFVNADIRSMDVAFQFNENKLSFDTAFAIVNDMELVSHFNSSDNYLRITSTRNSAEGISTGSVIAHIKFVLLNPCEVVYSTDIDSLHVWLNGEESGFEIIDGATLPDPIQILSNAPYCVGSPIDLAYSDVFNGVLIQNYAWSFGDGSVASGQLVSASISAPGATPILLTMTGVNGCVYQVPSEIFVSTSPVASFTYSYDSVSEVVTFANSSTIASGTISSYDWSFGDGGVSSDANPTYTYTTAGIFNATLTATSAQGCASEYSMQVNASVGVDELLNKSVVAVYPNPANSIIHVVAKDVVSVSVVDYSGRFVMQRSLRGGDDQTLDISALADGVYNVVIQTETGMHTTRIIKIK